MSDGRISGRQETFKIEGPAVISFSGGRSSAYMLWRILQAHGGKLPNDVRVIFCNTGKEANETLDFVQECGEVWDVQITWLEYRSRSWFVVVNHERASRDGEPFNECISDNGIVPSMWKRFCTKEMKMMTTRRYLKSIGWTEWANIIGLRADEQRRVSKLRGAKGVSFIDELLPLADAGVGADEVHEFWANSPFKLNLEVVSGNTLLGNCDLCFMKSAGHKMNIVKMYPHRAYWWASKETKELGSFRPEHPSYEAMIAFARDQGELFSMDEEPAMECMCTD